MCQFSSLVNSFKKRVVNNEIELLVAVSLFVDIISDLEWDLEDFMDEVPTDSSEYVKKEFAIVAKLLLEQY